VNLTGIEILSDSLFGDAFSFIVAIQRQVGMRKASY